MYSRTLVQNLILVMVVVSLLGCEKQEEPKPQVIPRVKAIEVTEQSGGRERTISGKLVAANQSHLSFAVGGTVKRVLVTPGQTVSQGEVLAELDRKPFELAVKQAKAELAIARTQKNEKLSVV